MPKRKIHAIAGAVAGLLLGLAALPGPALGQALKVIPPEMKFTTHKLDNGLTVLLLEDHSVPIVNVQIWFHVGSKDETKGRSGFAHLFEHIMFKGSANIGPDQHIDFVQSIGGRFNASTTFDRTEYWETVPSQYLERILWMEADRLSSLDISDANFKSERDVVKEERRQRYDNPPYGHLLEVVLNNSYTAHPYRIAPIGTMADLNAATLDDVRAFHALYYVPNNATLVITGDFNPDEALGYAKKYFGPIPQGKPIPRNYVQEPAQTGERRAVEYDAKAPLPAIFFNYHIPKALDPDIFPLRVAALILSAGQSSRLYKSLVYDKQMAVSAGGQLLALEDPGLFYFFTILQAGNKTEDVEKTLLDEVARLQQQQISTEELDKAKNQSIAGLIFGLQTVAAKGEALGDASIVGDPALANRQVESFQKVTAADVQRVAQKYFRPENRTVVYMLPEAMRPSAAGDQGGKP
jgi:zinc protease